MSREDGADSADALLAAWKALDVAALDFATKYHAVYDRMPIILHHRIYTLAGELVEIVESNDCAMADANVVVAGAFGDRAKVELSQLSLRWPIS